MHKQLSENEKINIVNVNENARNGQFKCAKCGSTEILFDEKIGALKCVYCGTKYKDQTDDSNKIKNLIGITKGKWANDIAESSKDIITIKCNSCGAEITINTKDAGSARCQWCRNILTANDVQNGTVPDKILPFKITKEDAFNNIKEYVEKDNKISMTTNKFRDIIKLENVMGVYMSYMMVDANVHAKLSGIGNHIAKVYKKENYKVYNIDKYNIEREFDLYVDDLIIESNTKRQDIHSSDKANNILNSVMPFDTENCLKFTANYLIGYNSEERDLNFSDLENTAKEQLTEISKSGIKADSNFYNFGIDWKSENIDIIGTKWYSVYLPVWVLSFQEEKKGKKFVHYIAVNGRTGKTVGSMPINNKFVPIALIIAIFLTILPFSCITFSIAKQLHNNPNMPTSGTISLSFSRLELFPSIILCLLFFSCIYCYGRHFVKKQMRNKEARYSFEKKTRKSLANIIKKDEKIKSITVRTL